MPTGMSVILGHILVCTAIRLLPNHCMCRPCSYRRDVKLDVYDWQEGEEEVVTKWRFSCVLDLPWKPALAAAGG